MTVGFQVGKNIDEIGSTDFLHAFFSTISYHLEPQGWGTRFPELMNELYAGSLDASKAQKVLADVTVIQNELKNHQPADVVWDIENLEARPPWGDNISPSITDLSNYFVTSSGRDVIGVLLDCLADLQLDGGCLTIVAY